jgi:hypothetical protein
MGRGVMMIAGLVATGVSGDGGKAILKYDPFYGWWFLNFGRNMILPTEALYHMLVLIAFFCALKGQGRITLFSLFLLSISHPFTGLQFILIFLAWSLLERFYIRNSEISVRYVAGLTILLGAHLFYYLVYLSSHPEHAALQAQWSLPWLLGGSSMLFGYLPVLLLVLWRIRSPELAMEVFSSHTNRLLLVWFLTSFFLANHEFAISPIQPLHFTRGHIWVPLFLLGAPSLIGLFSYLLRRLSHKLALVGVLAVLAVSLSDNALWFLIAGKVWPTSIYMSDDTRDAIGWLQNAKVDTDRTLLLSNDHMLSYVAMVYTSLRSWYSHVHCTPFAEDRLAELKAYFKTGREHPLWAYTDLLIVIGNTERRAALDIEAQLEGTTVFVNSTYRILMRPKTKSWVE